MSHYDEVIDDIYLIKKEKEEKEENKENEDDNDNDNDNGKNMSRRKHGQCCLLI
jgi:hypothetical protein